MKDFYVLMDGKWWEICAANHPETDDLIWTCELAYCDCDGTSNVCSFCQSF